MSELSDLTATELLDAYGTRTATPIEATEACLRRIDAVDDGVGAVLTLEADRAFASADAAAKRWQAGNPRPLDGVPYGVKDIIFTEGVRTTGGSAVYEDLHPTESAAVVTRMEAAGAVRVAKLQTFEFALGGTSATTNPWGSDFWPAGSSSGSAAAVAARELPIALGTDTGGSIAIPSSMCGVSGLKPTFGRVPRSGVMALSWSLDHVGPIARSAEDLARTLRVLAGPDPLDPTSSVAPVPDYPGLLAGAVRGLRVARPQDWFLERCHPEIARIADEAVALLVERGARVIDVELPATRTADLHAIEMMIIFAELASLHSDPDEDPDRYGPEFRRLFARAQFVSAVDYLHALRARHLVQRDFEAAFELADVFVVPAVVYPTPRLDDLRADLGDEVVPLADVVARTTAVFNIVGAPTVTVPAGFDSRGMPVGVQIAARPHADALALRVAHEFQQLTDVHRRAPVLDLAAAGTGTSRSMYRPIDTTTKDGMW
jgi:aspartyl-tRNA(Asn)/glutamyl-tRNA(Gln) amidotransferase subunit A